MWARAADPEVERTWEQARLAFPEQGRVVTGALGASLPQAAKTLAGRKLPVVVYLHGCSGLDSISSATAAFLAGAGYLVVSPDSFARLSKPASCDVATHASGLHRGVLAWRQAEAANAVAEVRRLPFVDPRRVYLYGFSEGAIAAATTVVAVRARIVEGWTCHAGWPEYAGIRFPASQPALTLTSRDDPWFQADYARGDCSDVLRGRPGSRSIVFAPPDPLSGQHWVSSRQDVQTTILDFLAAH